eukprot:TRINITY_DN5882_c0_g1_i1.p1 TRINITY_DN5882_c0_g1~~TRINITY_DN5882_c0_g1_i1.p1  ORF type:complete len:440 (-),score=92.84 TRINITY_DN5882_c0_g1_i1:1310-2629(-)
MRSSEDRMSVNKLPLTYDDSYPDEKAPLIIDDTEFSVPEHAKTSSSLLVVANIVKSFIGAGMLGMPYAYSEGGYAASLVLLIAMSILNGHTIMLMVRCKNELPKGVPPTYEGIGRAAGGLIGETATHISVTATQLGFCASYVVFIGQNMVLILKHFGLDTFAFATWPWIVLPLFVVLSWIRHLKYLAPFSLVANLCLVFGVVSVSVRSAQHLGEYGIPHDLSAISFGGLPVFIGVATFAFEGVGLVLPIENAMKSPEKFPRLFGVSLVFVTILVASFGLFNYLAWGSWTPNVITNVMGSDPLQVAVIAALCTALLISFPVQMFPVTSMVERTHIYQRVSHRFPVIFSCVWRAALCALLCGVAVALGDNFGLFVSLVGNLGGSTMAFVLPAIFHWRLFRHRMARWEVVKDWAIVVFAIGIGAILGTTVTIMQYVAEKHGA